MISTLHEDSTTESRCLALVAKYAPIFMRCGGGALDEREYLAFKPVSEAEKARIVTLARENPDIKPEEIARRVRRSGAAVRRVLRKARMGIISKTS